MKMKHTITKVCALLCIGVGIALTAINLYGLSQDIRPQGLFEEDLRFENDISLDYQQTMQQLVRLPDETDSEFAARASFVISQGLAHIHWKDEADPRRYNQLVPIWENYFLYFMGIASNIPEYQKYHFADYDRSIKRGIGICGDASMILSQVLDKQGIPNQLLSFPGHVVLAAKVADKEFVFDPDFGVSLPFSPDEIAQAPSLVNNYYRDAGYTTNDLIGLNRIYHNNYERWDGVKHFITKKYYFEKVSYWLKWPLPLAMLVFGGWLYTRQRQSV
jgi:hypothetical protein